MTECYRGQGYRETYSVVSSALLRILLLASWRLSLACSANDSIADENAAAVWKFCSSLLRCPSVSLNGSDGRSRAHWTLEMKANLRPDQTCHCVGPSDKWRPTRCWQGPKETKLQIVSNCRRPWNEKLCPYRGSGTSKEIFEPDVRVVLWFNELSHSELVDKV